MEPYQEQKEDHTVNLSVTYSTWYMLFSSSLLHATKAFRSSVLPFKRSIISFKRLNHPRIYDHSKCFTIVNLSHG